MLWAFPSWGLHLASRDFKMAATLLGLRTLGSQDPRASSCPSPDLKTLGLTMSGSTAGYASTPGPITEAKHLSHWLRHRSCVQSWTNQCQGAGLRAAQNLGPEVDRRSLWKDQSWREERPGSSRRRGPEPLPTLSALKARCARWKEAILNQESRRKSSSFLHVVNHRVKELMFLFSTEMKSLRVKSRA